MQPTYATVAEIFGLPRQYTVPLFQRPYVWDQQTQWEPLWEDVQRLADSARVGSNPQPHFLGSVVFEKASQSVYPERRDVIDGQQRLTTLQVLLKAAHDAFSHFNETDRAVQLKQLLRNHLVGDSDSEQTFKVLPTNADRESYRMVMHASSPIDVGESKTRITDAYRYFHGKIMEWLTAWAPTPGQARDALFVTIIQRLKCVVLDLDQNDEAQVIFETLNARGTPLLPADLVKNWLLREVERRSLHPNLEQLYQHTWLQFDQDHSYWRKLSGRGHTARARIDTYLANYLALRLERTIGTTHLYSEFLTLQKRDDPPAGLPAGEPAVGPVDRLKDLRHQATAFRRIDEANEPGRLGLFLKRLKALDVVSLMPFLLMLLSRPNQNSQTTLAVVQSLESFLVRRMVCGLNTRGYNTFFVDLLSHVSNITDESAFALAVDEFLKRSNAESGRWPTDREFTESLCSESIYRRVTRPRLRMILMALEQAFHSSNTETISIDESDLEIEHILPQAWEAHWQLPPDIDQDEAKRSREQLIHTIGNLTLVTERLNPSMSNAPWLSASTHAQSKRAALATHSILRLNFELVHSHQFAWGEDSIRDRSVLLARKAIQVWGGPDGAE